jgi:hypothetical protein
MASVRAEVIMVNPTMAKTLRSSCHFERQRAISQLNVARLALEMRRGWFIKGTAVTFAVFPDGSMVIVNGNHTLDSVIESGVAIPLTFIYIKVQNMDAAARIYACMDLQKTRTWANATQAMGTEIPMANYVVPAIGIIMAGFKSDPTNTEAASSRNARLARLEEYRDAATILAGAYFQKPTENQQLLRRAAFVAVALETARYQPSSAELFWGGAAEDDGLSLGDPRKALLKYAKLNKANGGSARRAADCKAAALAWNAWFKSAELRLAKPGAMGDFRLLGTPWHKGEPGVTAAATAKPMFEIGILADGTSAKSVARFAG